LSYNRGDAPRGYHKSGGYDGYMDGMKEHIERHIHERRWGPWCTAQRVRESIVVSLLGMRTGMHGIEGVPREKLLDMWKRCDQIRTLVAKGDKPRCRRFIRQVRSYQRTIADRLGGPFPDSLPPEEHDHDDHGGTIDA